MPSPTGEGERNGFVYTFYSYKGGTGRSMALANIAALMCQAGFRVLAIDWDLEAPGLERYFSRADPRIAKLRKERKGVVDLIEDWVPAHRAWLPRYKEWVEVDEGRTKVREEFREVQRVLLTAMRDASAAENAEAKLASLTRTRDEAEAKLRAVDAAIEARFAGGSPKIDAPSWKSAVIEARTDPSGGELHFLTAGKDDGTYSNRVNRLRWTELFAEQKLGLFLEQLRDEWKEEYDFILIDSRTGISDIEGICTVLLPDALVLLFTTMDQSVDGVLEVWEHARKKRAQLPVARGRLLTLPLPSRDEVDREHDLAGAWHEKYADRLGDVFREWLPKNVKDPRKGEDQKLAVLDAIKQLVIPYKAIWSFGERLPVVEREADIKDPRSINAAYNRVASLLVSRLSWERAMSQEIDLGLVRGQSSTQLPAVFMLLRRWVSRPIFAWASAGALLLVAFGSLLVTNGQRTSLGAAQLRVQELTTALANDPCVKAKEQLQIQVSNLQIERATAQEATLEAQVQCKAALAGREDECRRLRQADKDACEKQSSNATIAQQLERCTKDANQTQKSLTTVIERLQTRLASCPK